MNGIDRKADLNLIRYAGCWEDADVLLEAVTPAAGESILCIASAGDNALALLASGASVHAIDLSMPQLFLTELKQMAFACFTHAEMLTLLGISGNGDDRIKYYRLLRSKLSASASAFWDDHTALIRQGIIHAGKFERYFHLFRSYFLPLVHSSQSTAELLHPKSSAAQAHFYKARWDTWRWRLLMRIFFSRRFMGRYGRDKAFLEHVSVPVAAYIRQKTESHLQSQACTGNYLLHMILTGHYGSTLPFYLREENFEAIRNNIDRLTLAQSSAEAAVREKSYQAYCCSNIFEYMSPTTFEALSHAWATYIPSGSRLAYWNLMNARRLSESNPGAFTWQEEKSKILSLQDKGFFYSRFLLETKI